ncbi:MAG: TIM barrel protein [Bacteroidales bacterium]|nr:TIM barrel protein [Bacteroidales bacterium]
MKRRSFLKRTVLSATALSTASFMTYGSNSIFNKSGDKSMDLKISLAQWSLHRQFQNGVLNPNDFASIAKNTYSINAVEYVNQFYQDSVKDEKFWISLKKSADDVDVKSLLIMVDDEGDLGDGDKKARKESVENHFKWVNAAKILDCHSIRVNAFGDESEEVFRAAMIDSMSHLSDYAAKENINVIIENHGLFSSNAKLIAGIVEQVNKPNFGTFPDFGNWCLSAKWGSTQGDCSKVYDRYLGVSEFMPFAKAVSAKSYNFNAKGEDKIIDYYMMLQIVKDAGYDGYIGIEYEGEELSEHEGILATKALIEKVWGNLD